MNWFSWAVVTALIWGVVPLLEKVGLTKIPPMIGLFYRCFGVVLGFMMLGFILKTQQVKVADVRGALFLVLGGFLASFLAQICFYHSLQLGEMSRVVPISASYPLIAFILGVVVLGEPLSFLKVLGAVLVVAGICVLKIG